MAATVNGVYATGNHAVYEVDNTTNNFNQINNLRIGMVAAPTRA
ncbi:hypothetical protein [Diaphorobacter caeni]|nr:hypothetical protein [Diaphorobacter caeni]